MLQLQGLPKKYERPFFGLLRTSFLLLLQCSDALDLLGSKLNATRNSRSFDLRTCLRSSLRLAISAALSSLVIAAMLPVAEEGVAAGEGGMFSLKSSSQLPGIAEATDREGTVLEGACVVETGDGFCWGMAEFCSLTGARPLNAGAGGAEVRAAGAGADEATVLTTGAGSLLSWSRLSPQVSSSSRGRGPLWKSAK
jgi:hypothetical protein